MLTIIGKKIQQDTLISRLFQKGSFIRFRLTGLSYRYILLGKLDIQLY